MLMTVYLYKNGVEMHKYNDDGNYLNGISPDIRRFRFPKKRINEVKELLSKFTDIHPKLEICLNTEMSSLPEVNVC